MLASEEARELLRGIYVSTVVGLRDRAIIATMTYTFARVGPWSRSRSRTTTPKRWWLRLTRRRAR